MGPPRWQVLRRCSDGSLLRLRNQPFPPWARVLLGESNWRRPPAAVTFGASINWSVPRALSQAETLALSASSHMGTSSASFFISSGDSKTLIGELKNAGRLNNPRSFSRARSSSSPEASYTDTEKLKAIKARGKKRLRLDEACIAIYPQYSRSLVQSWIMQGKVLVDGQPVMKAGTAVKPDSVLEIVAKEPKFVCRAGYKLEGALDAFGLDVTDKVALDAGLSTGGFTDCLLQRGARKVYGVDVGYGQVAEKIRTDKRVVVMERTNLRYLESLPELVDLVTLDLSFISLLLVMPAVLSVSTQDALFVTLVKPQFEARRDQVGAGGIIRSAQIRKEVVEKVLNSLQDLGLQLEACTQSPIKGSDGNVEYLALLKKKGGDCVPQTEDSTQQPTVNTSRIEFPGQFFEVENGHLLYRNVGGTLTCSISTVSDN